MNKTICYKENDTAAETLERVLITVKKDLADGKKFQYRVREFSKDESLDVNGEFVPNNEVQIEPGQINSGYVDYALILEDKIGAPNLPGYSPKYANEVKLRGIDDVCTKLLKFRKKAVKELKSIRETFPDAKETTSLSTIGALEILNWVVNDGNYRTLREITERLYRLIVARERDKLFYIRRHPKVPILHSCQNEEILSQIEILKWICDDVNVFSDMPKLNGHCNARI